MNRKRTILIVLAVCSALLALGAACVAVSTWTATPTPAGHDHQTPRRSLLMRAAMSGARVQTDPAGNAKLAKGGQGRWRQGQAEARPALPVCYSVV